MSSHPKHLINDKILSSSKYLMCLFKPAPHVKACFSFKPCLHVTGTGEMTFRLWLVDI